MDKIGLHQGELVIKQAGKGEKRKLEGQPSLQRRRKRRKDIEEKNCEEKYRSEKEKIKSWLNGNTKICRTDVKKGKTLSRTPEIKKIKFKHKIESQLPGSLTKKGKVGGKVKKIKEFFSLLGMWIGSFILVAVAIFLQISFVEYVQVETNPSHQSGWQFVGMIFESIAIFIIGVIVTLIDVFRGGSKGPKLFLKTSFCIILFILFVGIIGN